MKGTFIASFSFAVSLALSPVAGFASVGLNVFETVCVNALIQDGRPDTSKLRPAAIRGRSATGFFAEFRYFETDTDMAFVQTNTALNSCGLVIIDASTQQVRNLWRAINDVWTFEDRSVAEFKTQNSKKHQGFVIGKSRGAIRMQDDELIYVSVQFVGRPDAGQITMNALLTRDAVYYGSSERQEEW